jgi:hypothetical protein
MAVKEFLDAVDKKKKAEEAAMAADAPVSAEVAPATPAMQAPIATPQQLDQMLADPISKRYYRLCGSTCHSSSRRNAATTRPDVG